MPRDKSAACIAAFVVIAPGLVHLLEDGAASSLNRLSRSFIRLAASHHAGRALLYDGCQARVRAVTPYRARGLERSSF